MAPGMKSIAQLRTEFVRRAALARQVRPAGVRGPAPHLFLGELATLPEYLSVRRARRRDVALRAQSVMLLPGFAAHPLRMRPMARALSGAGHRVEHWGLGFNLGPNAENLDFLVARVTELARANNSPIALVGWSLGGLFAREIARRVPHTVSKVITLGTPFSGDRHANNVWRAYQLVTGHAVDDLPVDVDFSAKPPVPTVALWSPRDGVVHPRAARGRPHERDRALALRCTHMGFTVDGTVFDEVLRQLDRDD